MRRYRTGSERKNIRSGRRGPELGTTVRHELCRSGIVAIQGEMRRSLLVDPLVEPIDREALVKAILAPIGCTFTGLPLVGEIRHALAPAEPRKIVQYMDENGAVSLTLARLHLANCLLSACSIKPWGSATRPERLRGGSCRSLYRSGGGLG